MRRYDSGADSVMMSDEDYEASKPSSPASSP